MTVILQILMEEMDAQNTALGNSLPQFGLVLQFLVQKLVAMGQLWDNMLVMMEILQMEMVVLMFVLLKLAIIVLLSTSDTIRMTIIVGQCAEMELIQQDKDTKQTTFTTIIQQQDIVKMETDSFIMMDVIEIVSFNLDLHSGYDQLLLLFLKNSQRIVMTLLLKFMDTTHVKMVMQLMEMDVVQLAK